MEVIDRLHSVAEAQVFLEKTLKSLARRVEKGLVDALGHVSASEVRAPMDLPPFSRSVLDGYAVKWIDISTASEASPALLRLKSCVPGAQGKGMLLEGEAVEVQTGSRIPEGSDTVVPREYTEVEGDHIKVYKPFPPGYGVASRGEDLEKGEVVLREGDIVTEWHIGVLASLGLARIEVWDKIRVLIASTGDELVEPGKGKMGDGAFASTGYMVASYLGRRGAFAAYKGIIGDDQEAIESFIEGSLASWDAVILTGGTSVGRRDYTARAIKNLADDYIHGLALTPGRPGIVASVQGKPVVGLSGMPVAAVSQLIAVWDPAYRRVLGRRSPWEPVIEGIVSGKHNSRPGMVDVVFSRACTARGNVRVYPLKVTGSGVLSVLIKANTLIIVPEEVSGLDKGDIVEARVIGDLVGGCASHA